MTKRQFLTRYLVGGVLVSLVAIGAYLALRDGRALGEMTSKEEARTPLNVVVARTVAVDQIKLSREFTGVVKAARESRLSFERTGRVLSMLVDEGDRVQKGQLLATIDVELVSARLDAANAELVQAQAVLAELVSGPRAETIASARAKVASLEATSKRLERDFRRSGELIANAAISQERYDATKFALEAAQAERDAAQRQLDELLAGTRTEKLDAQRAAVRQLEARVQSLILDLEDGNLHAPFSGRIAERLVDEGTVVTAGTTAFQIVEVSSLEAWIGIPRTSARHLQVGQFYDVWISGRAIPGELISLRPQLDSVTRTQNVILQLHPSDTSDVVPGEIARFAASEQIDATGFRLPTTALIPGARGLWNIFVVDETITPHVVEQRNVELLYSLGDSSLVDGTLRKGEAVVIDGAHRISAGQEVRFDETTVEVTK